jgi:preprotein translocase subunit YajC
VNIATLLPFILIIGVMLLMTRSAKNKQRQATQMRDQMQPGTGVRTIGGMIALVKEVRDTTVLLEVAPGVHSIYAKNAVGAVLSEEEYDRLVNNDVPLAFDEHADEAAAQVDEDEAVTADAAPDEPADAHEESSSEVAEGVLAKDTSDAKDTAKDAEGNDK